MLFLIFLFAADTGDLLIKLQKSYESVKTIQAEFEQVYRSKRFDEKKAKGILTIAKPGKMRWDYDEPKGKVLVSDGKKMTLFDPEDRQAMVSDQPPKEKLPVALSFLWGEAKLSETFRCELVPQAEKEKVLKCTPKKPIPNVSEIDLTLSTDEPLMVTRSRVFDEIGGESDIHFKKIRRNVEVSDKKFAFSPPPGTEVVSMGNEKLKIE